MRVLSHALADARIARGARERAKLRLDAVHYANAHALTSSDTARDVRAFWVARCAYHQSSLTWFAAAMRLAAIESAMRRRHAA